MIGHAGIFVPEAGVVNPYEMTISVYNTAILSGCTGVDGCKVISIERVNGIFITKCENGRAFSSKFVINAAGVYADAIAKMFYPESELEITPRRGEEYMLDNKF